MPEAEFDSYLSLLSKFLRLRSRQRAELADELRDHLDSRLEELLAAGKTRDEAIGVALEEFGDAAVLATEFSRLASRRTKRFVMRCTAASAAVVAAVVLVSLALAPPGPDGLGPGQIVAQQGPSAGPDGGLAPGGVPGFAGLGGMPAVPEEISVEQEAVAALDKKLAKPVKAEFENVPLRDVIEAIANDIEADALIDEGSLEESAVSVDEPVTVKLTRTTLSARTVLGFVLEPQGLTFVNRSGVIFITTNEIAAETLFTKVYNVRDLLENATQYGSGSSPMGSGMEAYGGGVGGGGFFAVSDTATLLTQAASQLGGGAMSSEGGDAGMAGMMGMPGAGMTGGGGLGGGPKQRSLPPGPAGDLINTIEQTTSGPWFDIDGVGGTRTVFNGLLTVRQTEQVHTEIQKLLDALRQADRQQPGSSVTVPKDEPAGMLPGMGAFMGEGGMPGAAADASMPGMPGGFAAAPKGLGARFADYHPTASMRQMFLGALGSNGMAAGEIGEVGMLQTLLGVNGPARTVFQNAGIDAGQVQNLFQQSFAERSIGDLYTFLDAAQEEAKKDGRGTIDSGHLLIVLLERSKDGPLRELLAQMGINADQVRDWVKEYRKATASEQRNPLQTAPKANGSSPDAAAQETSLRSTTRIRMRDLQGLNIGSGTVIGSLNGNAIILTCWHIFRDVGDDAAIEVDLFADSPVGPPKTLTGRLIASDRAADLGLVAVESSEKWPAVDVAGPGEAVKEGDAVYSIGCSNGSLPTLEQHVVTRINPYTGPASIECTGMPPVGRNGAGLFTSEGRLAGVCFAAARETQSGVYVGLSEIHKLLEKAGAGSLISQAGSN